MGVFETLVHQISGYARQKRARLFRESFAITPTTRILDIGSEDGSAIAAVLDGTHARPDQVYIADIDPELLRKGRERYGFVPTVIPESGRLPFEDGFFDIVYCSSVIEHVTAPKNEVWGMRSGSEFRRQARQHQHTFAAEIRRLGKRYYVQTPNKWFPVESHTWLPFVGYLPRWVLVPLLTGTNRVWVKRTNPDWHLLAVKDMRELFPDAEIARERLLGFTKSIMAIKTNPRR